ncbi:MAG: hypothetical protein AAFR22_26850, partial [Chloroflexota bacterium]
MKHMIALILFALISILPGYAADSELPLVGKIAYTALPGELQVLDLQTNEVERFSREYAQLLISPDWHHEGRLLATDEELLVLDTVTNEREFLRVEGLFPAWHPTQNRLLFSQRGGIVLHDFELDESVSITFPTVRA